MKDGLEVVRIDEHVLEVLASDKSTLLSLSQCGSSPFLTNRERALGIPAGVVLWSWSVVNGT